MFVPLTSKEIEVQGWELICARPNLVKKHSKTENYHRRIELTSYQFSNNNEGKEAIFVL
jgi:hypothetical protein